jgi:hypothetical protein
MGAALPAFAVLEDEFMHTEEITVVWYGPPWGQVSKDKPSAWMSNVIQALDLLATREGSCAGECHQITASLRTHPQERIEREPHVTSVFWTILRAADA